jgi:lactobin A/cerein 7B family class IIb bacteriocin
MNVNTLTPELVELSADELNSTEGGIFPIAAAVLAKWCIGAFVVGLGAGVGIGAVVAE